MHSHVECTAAKMARKYNYLKNITLNDHDVEHARRLDATYRACDVCTRWEARKRNLSGHHRSPPGFRVPVAAKR